MPRRNRSRQETLMALVPKSSVLPERLVNVIRCKNPRCISTTEQELPQVFVLTDREKGVYRCRYCETKAERQG